MSEQIESRGSGSEPVAVAYSATMPKARPLAAVALAVAIGVVTVIGGLSGGPAAHSAAQAAPSADVATVARVLEQHAVREAQALANQPAARQRLTVEQILEARAIAEAYAWRGIAPVHRMTETEFLEQQDVEAANALSRSK